MSDRKEQAVPNPWQILHTDLEYENPWIRVSESRVINPGGGEGIYGVVHFKNRATGVIPVDEEDHTWLVGQYRYPTDSYEWEIPEGGCPEGETPLEAAKRELKEETGLVASDYAMIIDGMQLSNSVCDELATVFVARGISQSSADPEESEDLRLRRLPVDEAIQMALDGEINDAISIAALLKLAVLRREKKVGLDAE